MSYSIHKVEDLDSVMDVLRMNAQLFPGAELDFGGQRWWVAYDDVTDEPVAFAALQHMYGDRGFLSRVGVLPAARGNGLQRRLIRARERTARALDLGRLLSYTSIDNVVSANNLIRCGYKLYRPEAEWGTRGALYFYRDL